MGLSFCSSILFHDIKIEIKKEGDESWKEKREEDTGFKVCVVEGQARRESRMMVQLKWLA